MPQPPTQVTSMYAQGVIPMTPTTSISVAYPFTWSGEPIFNMTIYATGLDQVQSFQVGFTFNAKVLQVLAISPSPWFFTGVSPGNRQYYPASEIDNTNGIAYYSTLGVLGQMNNRTASPISTAEPLFMVEFEVNPTLTPAQILAIAGEPQTLMNFSTSTSVASTYQTIFTSAALTNVTPAPDTITNSTFTITVAPPTSPTAVISTTPSSKQVYKGASFTFSSADSLNGWDGIETVPINDWDWNVYNTTWSHTQASWVNAPSISYVFPTNGTYTVWLNVSATNSLTPGLTKVKWWNTTTITVTVLPAPTGCSIDLMSQNWRYIDPFYLNASGNEFLTLAPLVGVLNGSGPGAQCELFRPGDLVELMALVTYGSAPVSNALVTFEVNGTGIEKGTYVIGTAISNNTGWAEWDFRIPWPCTSGNTTSVNGGVGSTTPVETNTTSEFGTWIASATWQCGSEFPEAVPFEKTQIDTMPFLVSWGLTILNVTTTKNSYARGTQTPPWPGDSITIKVAVENDYMMPVTALVTAEVEDNLLVPVGYTSQTYTFPAGTGAENPTTGLPIGSITIVTMAPIQVTPYAFVGTAYAFANLLTTWPWSMGTAFCPQVFNSNTFKITV